MRKRVPIVALLSLMALQTARADEAVLTGGERLTGKIVRLERGDVIFNSVSLGTLRFPLAKVRTLTSDEPVEVQLDDGTVVRRRVDIGKDVSAEPVRPTEAERQPFGVAQPPPSITARPSDRATWDGYVSIGGFSSRGNYDADMGNVNLGLTRRDHPHRTTFAASYFYGEQTNTFNGDTFKTQDNGVGSAKHDVFLYDEIYAYAHVRAERNALALLDWRIATGPGLGCQWAETETFSFATEAGVSWFGEDYVGDFPRDEHLALRLAYQVEKKLSERVTLFHRLEYYPNFNDFGDWFLTAEAGWRLSLSPHFFTEFRFQLDHDADPALLEFDTDHRYILSIGWNL